MTALTYDPSVFDAASLSEAKEIILTFEDNLTSAERWEREGPYLAELMIEHLRVTRDSVVLDYGCGVGRLARELIERRGCRVVGVDISARMRAFAAAYVGYERFFACHPSCLPLLGEQFDSAICVWTLQHCLDPAEDIVRIRRGMSRRGRLFVVNEHHRRCVPTQEKGWIDDGLDVHQMLSESPFRESFKTVVEGRLDPAIVTKPVSERTLWSVHEK